MHLNVFQDRYNLQTTGHLQTTLELFCNRIVPSQERRYTITVGLWLEKYHRGCWRDSL